MKPHHTSCFMFLFFALAYTCTAQKIKNTNAVSGHGQLTPTIAETKVVKTVVTETPPPRFPIKRGYINKRYAINPQISMHYFNSADTVFDLAPYAQTTSCSYQRSIDEEGCILVKYDDGLTKKICEGELKEVITPGNKKYIKRPMQVMMMAIQGLAAPPNPSAGDVSYQWITNLNDSLMSDIRILLANNQTMLSQFSTRENKACGTSIFRQIEYRMVFIENYFTAR